MEASPYLSFNSREWHQYRDNSPLSLTSSELASLRGFNETISLSEVEAIYSPISRLISLYVGARQTLHLARNLFLSTKTPKVPYIIGVAGSVAVGKSTTSRILKTLINRWPQEPKVVLVNTDGFLLPNEQLKKNNLMHRKGFPESYDLKNLIQFLHQLKSGQANLKVPVYSHQYYDILPNQYLTVDQPDIVILEGLNVLQKRPKMLPGARSFVADFLDFTLFVSAEVEIIKSWYLERFMAFREQAFHKEELFFHQFSQISEQEARDYASWIWHNINEANLIKNILPDKFQADLILEKDEEHKIKEVHLRKL